MTRLSDRGPTPERAVLAKAVRQALAAWPGSLRTLAQSAGVSHTLLNQFAAGAPCTPRVARRLARALRQHEARLTDHAARLEALLKNMQ